MRSYDGLLTHLRSQSFPVRRVSGVRAPMPQRAAQNTISHGRGRSASGSQSQLSTVPPLRLHVTCTQQPAAMLRASRRCVASSSTRTHLNGVETTGSRWRTPSRAPDWSQIESWARWESWPLQSTRDAGAMLICHLGELGSTGCCAHADMSINR